VTCDRSVVFSGYSRFLHQIISPKRSLGDILCLLRFLLSPQTKIGDLLFLHRFLLLLLRLIVFAPFLIKSPNEVWRLIVFAPFLIIITSVNTEMCCPKGKCRCQYFILCQTTLTHSIDNNMKSKTYLTVGTIPN
jgi:hypothetical protein